MSQSNASIIKYWTPILGSLLITSAVKLYRRLFKQPGSKPSKRLNPLLNISRVLAAHSHVHLHWFRKYTRGLRPSFIGEGVKRIPGIHNMFFW